jgi:hypothetical protein
MQDYMRVDPLTGQPRLDWAHLTRDQAAALSEVTVDEYADGEERVRRVKFRLHDKRAALVNLHQMLYPEESGALSPGQDLMVLIRKVAAEMAPGDTALIAQRRAALNGEGEHED